jgi:hypothetical protein
LLCGTTVPMVRYRRFPLNSERTSFPDVMDISHLPLHSSTWYDVVVFHQADVLGLVANVLDIQRFPLLLAHMSAIRRTLYQRSI